MSPPGLPDHLGTLPSKKAHCGNIKSSETMERSWTIPLRYPWGSAAATSTCLNKIFAEYRLSVWKNQDISFLILKIFNSSKYFGLETPETLTKSPRLFTKCLISKKTSVAVQRCGVWACYGELYRSTSVLQNKYKPWYRNLRDWHFDLTVSRVHTSVLPKLHAFLGRTLSNSGAYKYNTG